MKLLVTCLLCLALAFAVHAQLSPTEQLAAQRQAAARDAQQNQQAAYQAQQNARRVATRRLPAPCVIPDSYYPLKTCAVSTSASACGRGWNAWSTFGECCQPGARGAFPQGCTDFSKEVTCWVPGTFYPTQSCVPTNNLTRCSYNWGRWESEAACCSPGAAHPDGCTRPGPCWIATEWVPSRRCSVTSDQGTCTRGWGAFDSNEECCQLGNGFAEGCFEAETEGGVEEVSSGYGTVADAPPMPEDAFPMVQASDDDDVFG